MSFRDIGGCTGRLVAVLVLAMLLPACVSWGQTGRALHIAVLSDTHVTDDPASAEYIEHLQRAIQQVNAEQVDAVLIAGDLADHGEEAQFERFKGIASALATKPYMVAGNHDVGGIASAGKPGPSQKRLDLYEKEIGRHFYTADLANGMKLVALDSSLFGSGNDLEKQQWQLLERELGAEVPARSRVVLMHYPPFVDSADEEDGYMALNKAERQRFLKLLEGEKAAVVITGHQHRPRETVWANTKLITAPPTCFGLPKDKQPTGWLMVDIAQDKSVRSTIHELGITGAGTAAEPVSTRVHIFYYPWYGAPPFENEYVHWQQGGHTPPRDIGSSFYPKLGAYSAADPKVLQQHMKWIRQAHIGVLAVSWWGQNSYEDKHTPAIMDAAAANGLKVAFHLEPYDGHTPEKLVDDIAYILKTYGKHKAFYRSEEQGGKPIFYNFETLRYPQKDWEKAIKRLRAESTEPVILLAQTTNLDFIKTCGFDGGYPYDVLTPFKDPSFLRDLSGRVAPDFRDAGKMFIPSVGPGYTDGRAVKRGPSIPDSARTRDGGKGTTYDTAWRSAIDSKATFITVTSFNEWHEGSQIEPAMATAADGYEYPAYAEGELQYIKQTAKWVDEFTKPADKQGDKPAAEKPSSPKQSSSSGSSSKSIVYLSTSSVDWKSILPPPPAEGSPEEQAEIRLILKIQAARTPQQVKQCKADEAFMPFTFAEVLGPSFNPDDLPITAKFLTQVLHDADHVSEAAKRSYDRKRPYLVDDKVDPCINRVKTTSYPSGHALRGQIIGDVLAEMFPEKKLAIMAVGRRIGDSRVLGGVHFPSDVEAGRTLAKAILAEMKTDPGFNAGFQKAKAECLLKIRQGGAQPAFSK